MDWLDKRGLDPFDQPTPHFNNEADADAAHDDEEEEPMKTRGLVIETDGYRSALHTAEEWEVVGTTKTREHGSALLNTYATPEHLRAPTRWISVEPGEARQVHGAEVAISPRVNELVLDPYEHDTGGKFYAGVTPDGEHIFFVRAP